MTENELNLSVVHLGHPMIYGFHWHDDVIKWKHFSRSPLCGKPLVTGEFPSQRPMKRSFDVFFDLRLNKRLSKQSWSGWFETPSRLLWRHCNEWRVISIAKMAFERNDPAFCCVWHLFTVIHAAWYNIRWCFSNITSSQSFCSWAYFVNTDRLNLAWKNSCIRSFLVGCIHLSWT